MKKYITIYFLLLSSMVSAQHINKHVRQANTFYKQGKFHESLVEYQKSLESSPTDPIVNYNLGNSLYRNNRFAEASDAYTRSSESRPESELAQKSFYNKGVALSKQKKLEESIVAYKKAVILNPSDEDARVNLQKALLELKKKQPPEQQKKQNEKKKQQNRDEQKQQQPKSNLTKKQVEQLLKALQQREQQVQQRMQQHRNRSAGKQEKDW